MKVSLDEALREIKAKNDKSFWEIREEGLDDFEYKAVLHCNYYSVVMKMRSRSLDKDSTVKFRTARLLNEFPIWQEQMHVEAHVLSELTSHRVPRLYRADLNFPYIALEYFSGKDFSKYGPFPEKKAVHAICLICDPLLELHSLGYVHCDLKPLNFFLSKQDNGEHVKLIDFGTVCEIGEKDSGTLSKCATLGTKGYLAPEQKVGCGKYIPATDIYGLCTSIVSMITGLKLEEEKIEFPEILERERDKLSTKLYDIVVQGTQVRMQKRFQTVSEFKKKLIKCL